jgi:hypothetical protein
MADQLFKKNQRSREAKRSKGLKLRSETWLFVCEGSKTEPNYIRSLVRYANEKSKESELKITVEGEGKNTISLIKSVEDCFDRIADLLGKRVIPYAKTFVLFDKDSFKNDQFDNAVIMAENRGYIPIWSNECFELWFILHYERFPADNGRKNYYKKLDKLLETDYEKSDDIFSIIHSSERIKNALKYAEALDKESQCESSPSKRVPCTQMFRLIRELERQLKIDLTKNSGLNS